MATRKIYGIYTAEAFAKVAAALEASGAKITENDRDDAYKPGYDVDVEVEIADLTTKVETLADRIFPTAHTYGDYTVGDPFKDNDGMLRSGKSSEVSVHQRPGAPPLRAMGKTGGGMTDAIRKVAREP